MPYALGIDVGTTHTAAAVCHLDGSGWSQAQTVRLGEHRDAVESVLWLPGDGSVVVGEDAAQRGVMEHRRVARGFVSRVGDDVPIVVGGQQYLAEELTAALINWVVAQVEARQGAAPEHVVVTHRASWGGYRRGLLHEALSRVGLGRVTLLARPIAAAEAHAAGDPTGAGGLLAVYHLGGETFEASVVRRLETGAFGLLGHLDGALGGALFDDALAEQLGSELDRDPDDPHARMDTWRLRRECTAAKELLSVAAEATVPVRSVGSPREVRVLRAQFEETIAPEVRDSAQTLLRCLRSARVHPGQLAAVVLVGGSSRTPLVGKTISAAVPCRVAVDADPETAVARGAALAALRLLPGALPAVAIPVQRTAPTVHDGGDAEVDLGHCLDLDPDVPPARPPVEVSPLDLPQRRSATNVVSGKPVVLGAMASVVVMLAVGLTVMLGMFGGDPPPGSVPTGQDTGVKSIHSVSSTVPPTTPPTTSSATLPNTSPTKTNQDEGGR